MIVRRLSLVLGPILVLLMSTGAVAGDRAEWWLAAGLGAGAVSPDQSLTNYRWDTTPTALYALEATAGRGRFAAGLRLSRWNTSQGTGLALADSDPQVRLTSMDIVGQVQVVKMAGWQLWGTALVGRLGIRYAPDQTVIPTGVPGGEITVQYDPIDEMNLGLGLALRRDFGDRASVGLVAEQSRFSLDTSHRRGDEIVSERQEFVNWSYRLQVSWVLDLG